MRKVALLADSWNRIVTADWVSGINEYNKDIEEPVSLFHFNSMGNWNKVDGYNQGEYNIFNLADLRQFDGIVIDVNNIHDKNHLDHVLELVRNSGVPCVSLGHFEEDLYYVGVDNAQAIKEMMEHVYKVHRCRSFMFIGGPKTNSENMTRAGAYKACLEQWGLKEEDNPMFYGTFEMVSGEEIFRQIVDLGLPMPDAFICANDNLAVGLMGEAQSRGYVIPRDFCVTGFDNVDKAYCYEPQVTTVTHQRVLMGKTCLQILNDLWEGKTVKKHHYIKPEISYTESCGCPLSNRVDFREYVKESIVARERQRVFDQGLIELETSLLNCSGFEEIFRQAGQFFETLDCDGATLIVDERMYNLMGVNVFPTKGFDRRKLMVVYAEDILSADDYVPYDEFLDEKRSETHASVFMFSPLHFEEKTIGMIVVKNAMFLYDNPCFYNIQSLLTRSLWETYQRERLIRANEQLDELYKQDALTGLYNRMAYFKTIDPMISLARQAGKYCLIVFLDCDDFKQINDTLGHDEGDRVLMRIGQILMGVCTKEGAAFRYGGDEFVLANPCDDIAEADAIYDQLVRMFEKTKIAISMGRVIAHPDDTKTIEAYINEADQDMYEHKRQRKSK